MTPTVTFALSMDVESDAWTPTRASVGLSNLRALPAFDGSMAELGVRPTYLPTYRVATDAWGSGLLRDLADSRHAEVGAHLHPWTCPPMPEALTPEATMLCNLPGPLQRAKLERLTEAVAAAAGVVPTSFRAGRWGLGPETVRALAACGYAVDGSVTPFTTWEAYGGPSFRGAPNRIYRLSPDRPVFEPARTGSVVEVPVSVGYTRRPFRGWARLVDALGHRAFSPLRLRGLAAHTGVVRRVFMSPETAEAGHMLTMAGHLLDAGATSLQLSLHSQSLTPGLSPFASDARDVERMLRTIRDLVEGLSSRARIVPATLTEIARGWLAGQPGGRVDGGQDPSLSRM